MGIGIGGGKGVTPAVLTQAGLTGRPEQLAPVLLGCVLEVFGPGSQPAVQARIVEVEAYGGVGEDPASHAHRGPTRGNATMFGPVGRLHIYFIYGMHWCANVVVHSEGVAGGVLLRAGAVTSGLDVARARRGPAVADRDLARGPARLTRALGLSGVEDGMDLLASTSRARLLDGQPPRQIGSGPRVGVSGDGAFTPWRWWDTSSPEVSAYRPAATRRRRNATKGLS